MKTTLTDQRIHRYHDSVGDPLQDNEQNPLVGSARWVHYINVARVISHQTPNRYV